MTSLPSAGVGNQFAVAGTGVEVRVLTSAQFASAIDEQSAKVREIVSTNKTVR